ncbi:hypothetical protein [Barnesiella intestinihominis]|uniref:hypothetical protein n=1 Tax=Barnesiella intestinihominis TaxID=487174 RepID=UPI003FEF7BAA
MTVQELIDELMKVKDKSKPLYSDEFEEEYGFPIQVEIKEMKKYIRVEIYEE